MITGTGAVTAAGLGVTALVEALRHGRSSLAKHGDEPWPSGRVDPTWVQWPGGPDWADVRKYAGGSSRLAVTAAGLALDSANIMPGQFDAHASGTVVVVEPDQTAWEPLAAVIAADDTRPIARRIYDDLDDFHILRSIPTQVSNFVARRAGFTGPQLAVARPCVGGLSGLGQAIGLIQGGEVDRVILSAADPCWSPYELAGLNQIEPFAVRHGQGCGPFDQRREGPFWGEGSAAVVLERREAAQERGARALARVVACETRCCAAGAAASLEAALEAALANTPKPPDMAWACGTGSREGDRVQAAALASRVTAPITATQGAIGTLYAGSAIVDLAMATAFLHAEELPPVCLLGHPDAEFGGLDLVCGGPRRIAGAEMALVTAFAHPRETGAGAACITRETGS